MLLLLCYVFSKTRLKSINNQIVASESQKQAHTKNEDSTKCRNNEQPQPYEYRLLRGYLN